MQIKIYGQRLECRSRVLNVPGQESFVDPKGDPGSHSTVPCIPKKEKRKEKGRRGGSEGREYKGMKRKYTGKKGGIRTEKERD